MFTLEIELEIVCTYIPVSEGFSDKTKEEIRNSVNVMFCPGLHRIMDNRSWLNVVTISTVEHERKLYPVRMFF
jgi:hypothetical protein